jgi:hypothetical protein
MQNLTALVSKILFSALCLALPIFSAQPAPKSAPAASANAGGAIVLNQKDIHEAYNEGDFDKVTALIEAFNRANKTYSRADSIFIAKHLAVVYSANPQSREKGKYYMYRLLEMMPSAELVDMFVSDEIDRIFDKVRKEFMARQKGFGVDSTQISVPEKPASRNTAVAANQPADAAKASDGKTHSADYAAATSAGSSNQSYWKRNGFWIAGGVGLIVAGTTAYFIYSDEQPAGKTIVIPSETTAKN